MGMRIYPILMLLLICVSNPSSASEMTFELSGTGGNCFGCSWVAAQGEITKETPVRFREFFKENPYPLNVVLNSEGGDLVSGMELGALFRELGVGTAVGKTVSGTGTLSTTESLQPGICSSACAFAFMGGVEREADEPNQLGVQNFWFMGQKHGANEEGKSIFSDALSYALRMGVNAELIALVGKIPANKTYWFDAKEIDVFGLVTEKDKTKPWRVEPYKNGLVLKTTHIHSSRRSTDISLFCRGKREKPVLVISEESDHYAKTHPNGKVFTFDDKWDREPRLRLGKDRYTLLEQYLEFQQLSGNRFSMSFQVPADLVSYAGKPMTFDPNLPRVYWPFLHVTVPLPERSWIEIITKNCVSGEAG